LSFAFIHAASAAAEAMEDVDYVPIAPQAGARRRIEVIEFFYYGCDSCYRFEPMLAAGSRRWRPTFSSGACLRCDAMDWVPLTRLYFALEEAGALDRLHGEVYKAIHEQSINLGDLSDLLKWTGMSGLERAGFEKILNSESVSAKVQKAATRPSRTESARHRPWWWTASM